MRVPFLRCLLVDCTGSRAKEWFYIIACFVSALTAVNGTATVIAFLLDFFSGSPLYYSLPHTGHLVLYTLCIISALLAALPPLVASAMAVLGAEHERHTRILRLCGMAQGEDFYSEGCITRYLLVSTLSAAAVIMFNTVSVGAVYFGVVSLFEDDWIERIDGIQRLQRHYKCCGHEGFGDWLKLAGRMPPSCNASTADIGPPKMTDSLKAGSTGLNRINKTDPDFIMVHSNGCLSPITSEQAIVCGIGNMLAFAGVLLLVAAWSRVERVSGISARELRNTVFNQPRHIGDEDDETTFLTQRQRRLANRYAVRSGSSQSRTLTKPSPTSETSSEALHLKETRLFLSEGYLTPFDAGEARRFQQAAPHTSTSGSDSLNATMHNKGTGRPARGQVAPEGHCSTNNSALGTTWISARVVNSIDRQVQLRRAWDRAWSGRKGAPNPGDSVQIVDELGTCSSAASQPLNARSLIESQNSSQSVVRRFNRVVVRLLTRPSPVLLEDYLSDKRNWRVSPKAFKTRSSVQCPLECS